MARARGIPRRSSESNVAPLKERRITRATLALVYAFQSEDEREVMRYNPKTKKREATGEFEMRTSQKLCLYLDSHLPQRDNLGEIIYDEETGETKPHYLVDGFVTVSDHAKSNLVSKVLPAIGFSGPEFFIADGKNKGNMTRDFADSLEVAFGSNRLGEDHSGHGDWSQLPFFERGGKDRKSDIEVEVTSLKLAGYELIGRQVDLMIGVDEESGFNRIEAYMIPADFAGLDNEPLGEVEARKLPGSAAKSKKAAPKIEQDDGLPRHVKYVRDVLNFAGVAPIWHAPLVRHLLSDESIQSLEDTSKEAATVFKQLVKEQGDDLADFMKSALADISNSFEPPFDTDDDDEDWEDDLPI